MSKPNPDLILVSTGPGDVERLLDELLAAPRRTIQRWSKITNQTSQVRIAYPGQHLATMITGVPGAGTAARGVDLRDGSEVKSCSRADQLGECRSCEAAVLPWQTSCPECDETDLKRKTDSHWILSMHNEAELRQYLAGPRLVLILFDRDDESLGTIRIRAWEVWTDHPRHAYFRWFVDDYFHNNYQVKIAAGRKAAPCNLHPLKFDFLMMNPVLVFEAAIENADEETAAPVIRYHCDPYLDRSTLTPEPMPSTAVRRVVFDALLATAPPDEISACVQADTELTVEGVAKLQMSEKGRKLLASLIPSLDERLRQRIPPPDKSGRIKMTDTAYVRRRMR